MIGDCIPSVVWFFFGVAFTFAFAQYFLSKKDRDIEYLKKGQESEIKKLNLQTQSLMTMVYRQDNSQQRIRRMGRIRLRNRR